MGYFGGATLVALFVLLLVFSYPADAAPDFYDDFENYTLGDIVGQQGWTEVASTAGNFVVDDAHPLFGSQDLYFLPVVPSNSSDTSATVYRFIPVVHEGYINVSLLFTEDDSSYWGFFALSLMRSDMVACAGVYGFFGDWVVYFDHMTESASVKARVANQTEIVQFYYNNTQQNANNVFGWQFNSEGWGYGALGPLCSNVSIVRISYIHTVGSAYHPVHIDDLGSPYMPPPTTTTTTTLPGGAYSLSGRVSNSTGGIPFAGVYGVDGSESFLAIADAGGDYSVNITAAGVYDIEAISTGYCIRCVNDLYIVGHSYRNFTLVPYNLNVSVYDSLMVSPVEGAVVLVRDDLTPQVSFACVSGPGGSCTLLVPEDRSYTLLVRKEGFKDTDLSLGVVRCTRELAINLENVSANYTTNVHVYDQYSLTDIPGALTGLYHQAPSGSLITYCMTDGTGRCDLISDLAGDYRLKTGYPGYMTDNRTITIEGDSWVGIGLIPQATYNLSGWVKKGTRNASGEDIWYSCSGLGWSYNITGSVVSNAQGYYRVPYLYNQTICQLSHDVRNYIDYTATVPILGHTTWNITLPDVQVYQFTFIDRLLGRPLVGLHANIWKNGTYSDTQVITGAMIAAGTGYAWVLAANNTNISLATESDLTAAQEFSHLTNYEVDAGVNYAYTYYLDRLSNEERGGCVQNFQIWPLQLRQNLSSLYYLHYQIQAFNLNDSLIFTYNLPIYLLYSDLRNKPYFDANLSCGLRHVITLAGDSPEYSMTPITFSSRYLADTIRLPMSLKVEGGGGSIGGSIGLPNQLLALLLGALGYDPNTITVFAFIVGLAMLTIVVILVAGMVRVVKGR